MRPCFLRAFGGLALAAALIAQQPVSLAEVEQWVGAGSLTPDEIVIRTQQRGLGFSLDDPTRQQLQDLGAPPTLISRLAAITPAPSPQPESDEAPAAMGQQDVEALFTDEILVPSAAPSTTTGPGPGRRRPARMQGPVTKAQILLALQLGASSERVEPIVQRRGAGFTLDAATREELAKAGAEPPLLDLIERSAANTAAQEPTPAEEALPEGARVFTLVHALDYDPYAPVGRIDLKMDIDHVTDIQIDGERIIHRNLMGQPAADAGSTMTQPLPKEQLLELRLVKKKGRGEYAVTGAPSAANGHQIRFRVYDPKAGADFYHFEITWNK